MKWIVAAGLLALVLVGCDSCDDVGPTPWDLTREPAPELVGVPGFFDEVEGIVPGESGAVPRETTTIGGREGAGPVGRVTLGAANVIIGRSRLDAVVAYVDLNGDGYDDIVVGDRDCCRDLAGRDREHGAVFVVYGAPDVARHQPLTNDFPVIAGDSPCDYFGAEVVHVGDFDGDGLDDFAAASPQADGFCDDGKAYPTVHVFFGRTQRYRGLNEAVDADVVIKGTAGETGLGVPLSSGDTDMDGYADLIVGQAHWFAEHKELTERLWVFYGSDDPPQQASVAHEASLLSAEDNTRSVWSITAGNVDADGGDEVLLGSVPRGDAASGGRVAVLGSVSSRLPPGSSIDELPGVSIQLAEKPNRVGQPLEVAGDVDGDGNPDVLVGDVRYGGAYGVRGPLTRDYELSEAASFVLEAPAAERFPLLLSDGGDVNGDGFADVLAVAIYADDPDTRGYTYLFYGGPGRLEGRIDVEEADAVFEGVTTDGVGDRSGSSLTTDGDFNGDGYDDIVIGARRNGRLYIVYGGP